MFTHHVSITFTHAEHLLLNRLAASKKTTRSALIRYAIHKAYRPNQKLASFKFDL